MIFYIAIFQNYRIPYNFGHIINNFHFTINIMKSTILLFTAFFLTTLSSFSQSFKQGEFTDQTIGSPVIIDMNNDDKPDVVALERNGFGTTGDLVLHLNTSQTDAISFDSIQFNIRGIGVPTVGDLDQDGDLDIVLGQWNGMTAVIVGLYNQGNLEFQIDTLAADDLYRHDLADLDGDGDLDLVSSNRDFKYFNIYENEGNGDFTLINEHSESDFRKIVLQDFDNDGDIDIVVGFNNFFDSKFDLWRNNGDATFEITNITESSFGNMGDFVVTDFDKDGNFDIVFFGRNTSSLRIISQPSIGTYEEEELITADNAIAGFSLANFDSENGKDILIGGENQEGITFYLNSDSGPFDFEASELVSGISPGVFIRPGDLDGDGDLDAVVSNGDFWWLENLLEQGSVNVFEESVELQRIYPNPFKNEVYIEEMTLGDILEVFDISGKLILRLETPKERLALDHLESGSYLFKFTDSQGSNHSSQVLIKE